MSILGCIIALQRTKETKKNVFDGFFPHVKTPIPHVVPSSEGLYLPQHDLEKSQNI
jgi:hypothetical protein